jgi:hypothetical protein
VAGELMNFGDIYYDEVTPPIRTTEGWDGRIESKLETIKHIRDGYPLIPNPPAHWLEEKVIGRRDLLYITDPSGREHFIGEVKKITRTDIMPEGPETIYTVNQRKPIGYEISWETR